MVGRSLPVWSLWLTALLVSGGGCRDSRRRPWELSFDPPQLEQANTRFEVVLRKGGCGSEGEVLAGWDVTHRSEAELSLSLAGGNYSLWARAVTSDCEWYAAGCAAFEIPRRSSEPIRITLREEPREPRCETGSCQQGRCLLAPPSTDAGPDASSQGEAGVLDGAAPVDADQADASARGDADAAAEDAALPGDGGARDAEPGADAADIPDAASDGGSPPEGDAGAGDASAGAKGPLFDPTLGGHDGHRRLDADYRNTCLVRAGEVWCWGGGGEGALGYGGWDRHYEPVRALGIATAQSVAVGASFACALLEGGEVWCWGANTYGQLGLGTNEWHPQPRRVETLQGVAGIAASGERACARTDDGRVYCWGWNRYGQLGTGGTTDEWLPTLVEGVNDTRGLALGGEVSCAIDSQRAVRCWGANWAGERSEGDLAFRPVPGPVIYEGAQSLSTARAGRGHTCAVSATGTVECWGGNWEGQLGNDSIDGSWYPRPATGLEDMVQVAAGDAFTCALDRGGTVWTWGHGGNGRLGRGGESGVPNPLGLSGINEIAVGRSHACAVNASDDVWCWGWNGHGQLGAGPGRPQDQGQPIAVVWPES